LRIAFITYQGYKWRFELRKSAATSAPKKRSGVI
jgi:hypothetical protein